MIEVDIFWSFAIGASMACAAGKQLAQMESTFNNKYFVYCIMVLSCIFSPSGCYLLMAYPGWETMFLLNRDIINKYPLIITVFNCTNNLFGIMGFYIAHQYLKYNNYLQAQLIYIIPYMIMFTILGLGYDRFLFPFSYKEYYQRSFNGYGKENAFDDIPSLESFFNCDVFYTLIKMGIILIPALYYPSFNWMEYTIQEGTHIKYFVLKVVYGYIFTIASGYYMFIRFYCNKRQQKYFNDFRLSFAGIYAPLFGYIVSMHTLFLLVLIPVFMAPYKKQETVSKRFPNKKKVQ